MWDNTPRRGHLGFVTMKSTPESFYDQIIKLLEFVPNLWRELGLPINSLEHLTNVSNTSSLVLVVAL